MSRYSRSDLKEKISFLFISPVFRVIFICAGFILCIVLRRLAGRFYFLLGYLYLTFISLSGLWFGMRGGVFAATVATLIFVLEINLYRYWAFRDLVAQTLFLRTLFYFLGGISMGYVSETEHKLKDQLKALAYYDELTGCVNFRWTMHLLQNELARAQRYGKEVTVAMLDLDFFKKINDKYGHLVGNEVLSGFSAIIKDCVRYVDIIGRYGGEEFLVILPEASLDQSLVVLQRIRGRLEKMKMTSLQLDVRFSAGIASFPYNGATIHELLTVVDNALYEAKRGGRNKIVVERRRWLRAKPLKDIRFEVAGLGDPDSNAYSRIKNLSRRGLLLLTTLDIPRKEFIGRVYFPGDRFPLEVNCEVVHKTKLGRDLFSVGIFFLDIAPSYQDRIFHSFTVFPEKISV